MSSTLSTKTTTQTTSTNFTSSVATSPTPTTLTTSTTSTKTTNIKPCCACPETKRNRDLCIFETGDEERCKDLIEAHKACMRSLGFNV